MTDDEHAAWIKKVVEYQPPKDEIPYYVQHEAGWCFMEKGKPQPFIFEVKFLTEDKVRQAMIYHSQTDSENDRGFFLKNKKSDAIIDVIDFVTSRIDTSNQIWLVDMRPRSGRAKRGERLGGWVLTVLDYVTLDFLVRRIFNKRRKKL
jgi:hypothetical protein